jgi:hypothetical protein
MFVIAIKEKNGTSRYWRGGDMWSQTAAEAARFVLEGDARVTIPILVAADPTMPPAHIVHLSESAD